MHSLMIMLSGIALYNYHWLNSIGVVMVLYAVINSANSEEKLLLMRFNEYTEYQQKTHRFLPYIY
jgi:protein-S-isoprenylcysteine O-methyltransferase Ste14